MWKPEQASALLLPDSTACMDKNTKKTTTDRFPAIKTITGEYVRIVENDNRNLENEIRECQEKLHGFKEMEQEKERLQEEVESLKETVAKYELGSRKSELSKAEKPDEYDERLKQLVDEISKLKTDLETSSRKVSFQSEEIKNLTATTIQQNNKLKKMSIENDELIIKLATSRDIESRLMKEITNLTDDFNRKQKILEERDAILNSTRQAKRVADKKVEDILQKSKLELQLAYQKNLDLTSMNAHLQIESKELKRKREVMKAEFRRVTKEKDAAFVFVEKVNKLAEESAQLADERKIANGLLQTNVTQLKTELTTSKSQINELKKEKTVLLYNASTWEATESELKIEIINLKDAMQTQNETIITKMKEIERLKAENLYLKPCLANLQSVRESLAKKLVENDEYVTRYCDLLSEKSLLEVTNDNLMKEFEDSRKELERIKRENQELWETREAVLQSAQKSEKLAKEQVEALSDALDALQEATEQTKDAAKARKAERESMNSGATKTKADQKKGTTWIKELFAKTYRKSQYEDEYANLLETTGLQMVERAKKLQDQANNIKSKGKALRKKAKSG
jgi:chromosome segregation ATPase